MNKIIVKYEIIEHPYPTEVERTVYGMINTSLVDENNKTIIVLTNQVWDLLQYFGWFIKNSEELLNQYIPNFFPKGGSIAERIYKFKDQVYDEIKWGLVMQHKEDEKCYAYSHSHSYFNSLAGSGGESDIKFSSFIYFGRVENGYEISMYEKEDIDIDEEHWKMLFDLPELIQCASTEFNKIINNKVGHNKLSIDKYFSK